MIQRVNKKIMVWGTGNYGTKFMEEIMHLRKAIPEEKWYVLPEIVAFIDSNRNTGEEFYEIPVYNPQDVDWDNPDITYVIAVLKNDDIYTVLREHISNNFDQRVLYIDQELSMIYDEILSEYRRNPFPIMDDELGISLNIRSIFDMSNEAEDTIEQRNNLIREACRKYGAAEFLNALIHNKFSIQYLIKTFRGYEERRTNKIKTVALTCGMYSKGGAERVISNLLPILQEKGYELVLITGKKVENEYPIVPGVKRFAFVNDLSKPLEYFRELEKIIAENNIDAVCIHIPFFGTQFNYMVMLFKLLGVYTIAVNHTSIPVFSGIFGDIRDCSQIYTLLDYLVVLSHHDEKQWKSIGINAVCITNPINMPPVESRSRRTEMRNNLLWVGRISNSIKGVFSCVYIIEAIKKSMPDIQLKIIGYPETQKDLDELRSLIIEHDVQDNIEICGYNSNPSEFYKKADLMIMTSPGEGFPMVLVEAKAYGLPIVMYDLPYLYFVEDGRGLITVPQGDYNGLASEVTKILLSDHEYNKLCDESLESYLDYISIDIGDKWKELFDSLENE